MKAIETNLPGVLIIESRSFEDERGFFMETWHQTKFAEIGIDARFVQDNHSRSTRGVLRGLHFQQPSPQGKLVRAVTGRIFDVAVDIRRGSPSFGRWTGVELSEENRFQLWVPEGFAHGFVVLSDVADVVYKCTAIYDAPADRGIAWNDPGIGIEWPVPRPILSPKDAALPSLKDAPVLPELEAGG
ncbi:MAG: dTDP-4-dehydrorhamnose 3,5-epimerase [Thermoanaerobaculia bacterium]